MEFSTKYIFFFTVISCCCSYGQCSESALKNNVTLAQFCIQETKVTPELVDSYINDPSKEPTEEFLCYLQCIFKGTGFINAEGFIVPEIYRTIVDADVECLKKLPKIVECNDMKSLTTCDKE